MSQYDMGDAERDARGLPPLHSLPSTPPPTYQLRLTYPGTPTFVEPIHPDRVWALVTRVHESGTRSWRCQRVEVRVVIGEYETIIAAAPQPEPGR